MLIDTPVIMITCNVACSLVFDILGYCKKCLMSHKIINKLTKNCHNSILSVQFIVYQCMAKYNVNDLVN